MRKKLFVLAAVLLSILTVSCAKHAESITDTNVLLVMDRSDSMKTTDEKGCSRFIANMLVSAFDDYKIPVVYSDNISTGVNVGIIEYGAEAEETVPLTSLSEADEEKFNEIREKIDNIKFNDTKGTNFYAGLKKAMDICEDNPAAHNIIFLISDGQIDLNGSAAGLMSDERKKTWTKEQSDYISEYNRRLQSGSYNIYTVGIDTAGESPDFSELSALASPDSDYVVQDDVSVVDIFAGVIEDIYKLLNPKADEINVDAKTNGNVCSFTLDKKYKAVQIFIADDDSREITVEKIKPPNSDEAISCSDSLTVKTGWFGKSTVTVKDNSGIAASVYIDNATKGEWSIYTGNEATIIAKVFVFNPFPWFIIPIIAAAGVLIIILLMWIFCIPPVRYRKKLIPGNITVSVSDINGSTAVIHENVSMLDLARTAKHVNKGNMTLASLLNDKRYKDIILKYQRAQDEFSDDSLVITNKGKDRTIQGCTVFSGSSSVIILGPDKSATILWIY